MLDPDGLLIRDTVDGKAVPPLFQEYLHVLARGGISSIWHGTKVRNKLRAAYPTLELYAPGTAKRVARIHCSVCGEEFPGGGGIDDHFFTNESGLRLPTCSTVGVMLEKMRRGSEEALASEGLSNAQILTAGPRALELLGLSERATAVDVETRFEIAVDQVDQRYSSVQPSFESGMVIGNEKGQYAMARTLALRYLELKKQESR